MLTWPTRSRRRQLGTGLWRRLHDNCATAARQAPALEPLVTQVRALSADAQTRWPSETLDVPSQASAWARYERLRDAERAFREVLYLSRLDAQPGGQVPDGALDDALTRARRALDVSL